MTGGLKNCVGGWQCVCGVADVLQLLRCLIVVELTLHSHAPMFQQTSVQLTISNDTFDLSTDTNATCKVY